MYQEQNPDPIFMFSSDTEVHPMVAVLAAYASSRLINFVNCVKVRRNFRPSSVIFVPHRFRFVNCVKVPRVFITFIYLHRVMLEPCPYSRK